MNSLIELDPYARSLRHERDALAAIVADLNREIELLQAKCLPVMKARVARAAEKHSNLYAAIDESRPLFVSPRTTVLHGIKLGLRKGTGGITWDDDEAVAKRIEDTLPKAQAELLVKTTKKPQSKALQECDASQLKKWGCRIEATGDVIVIKPTDTAVDKLVNALLKSAVEETQSEQEAA